MVLFVLSVGRRSTGHGDRVGLLDVEICIVKRADYGVSTTLSRCPKVNEKRVRVGYRRFEFEIKSDVCLSVSGVVDIDRIQGIRIEVEEGWPAGRFFKGNVVGNDRRRIRTIRADKRIDIRVVRQRVLTDQRSLTVTGCGHLRSPRCERNHDGGDQ